MPNIYFRGNTNEIWRISKDDSDGESIVANSGETLVKKNFSQSDFDLIVAQTKRFDESLTQDNIVLVDTEQPTRSILEFKQDFENEIAVFDKFLEGTKTSTMRDRLAAYRARLSAAFSHAMLSENETFSVHCSKYTSDLNPGEEVFHMLQVCD